MSEQTNVQPSDGASGPSADLASEIKRALGEEWSRISFEQRDAILLVARSAARIGARLALGETVSDRAQRHLRAQLANLDAIVALNLQATILSVVERVLGMGVRLLGAALKGAS